MKVGKQFKPGGKIPKGTPLIRFYKGKFLEAYISEGFDPLEKFIHDTWYLWEDYEEIEEPKPKREPRRGELWRVWIRNYGREGKRVYDGPGRFVFDPSDLLRGVTPEGYDWIECLYSPYDKEGENNES